MATKTEPVEPKVAEVEVEAVVVDVRPKGYDQESGEFVS